jgi:antitoxin ParD1/3/4
MHISLTPALEKAIKARLESGLYNNASEVVREALRFMESHEGLVYQMKVEALRRELRAGEQSIESEGTVDLDGREEMHRFFEKIKEDVYGKGSH